MQSAKDARILDPHDALSQSGNFRPAKSMTSPDGARYANPAIIDLRRTRANLVAGGASPMKREAARTPLTNDNSLKPEPRATRYRRQEQHAVAMARLLMSAPTRQTTEGSNS